MIPLVAGNLAVLRVRKGSFARPEAVTLPRGGDGRSFTSLDRGDNDR
jgi:hypothetical protein